MATISSPITNTVRALSYLETSFTSLSLLVADKEHIFGQSFNAFTYFSSQQTLDSFFS